MTICLPASRPSSSVNIISNVLFSWPPQVWLAKMLFSDGGMSKNNTGTCLSYYDALTADVHNRGRQKYGDKPGCPRAAKAARQGR